MSFGFKLSEPQSGLNSQHLSSCSDSGRYCQSYRCSVCWCHGKWCWLWPARTDKMLVVQAAVEQQQPVAWHGTSWATCAWCVFTGLHWSWLLALLAARVVWSALLATVICCRHRRLCLWRHWGPCDSCCAPGLH